MKWKRKNSFTFNFLFSIENLSLVFSVGNGNYQSSPEAYVCKSQNPKTEGKAISVFESHGKQLAI